MLDDGKVTIQEYIQNTKIDPAFAHEVFKFIDKDGDESIPRADVGRIYNLYDKNGNLHIYMYITAL